MFSKSARADDAAMPEPGLDVANFLAHLELLALEERRFADTVAAPAAAFLDRYRALDSEVDLDLVDFLGERASSGSPRSTFPAHPANA